MSALFNLVLLQDVQVVMGIMNIFYKLWLVHLSSLDKKDLPTVIQALVTATLHCIPLNYWHILQKILNDACMSWNGSLNPGFQALTNKH